MDITNIISIVFGGGGAISGVLAWVGNRRMAAAQAKRAEAEADTAETNNAILAGHEWKAIAENREEKIKAKDEKIDQLYAVIGQWRDKYNKSQEDFTELKVEKATKIPTVCEVRNCPNRKPQSGY